ncbi:hypothetical protein PM082_006950 [Marasmius tenuissimus]|nr:hypothetical protein PM082_006950 [Marasmius tenuissimus]
MGSFIIHNKSPEFQNIQAFVSNYCGQGSDSWYSVKPGQRDSWGRKDGWWEIVAFKDDNDTQRAGVYCKCNSTVIFYSFDDIRVE